MRYLLALLICATPALADPPVIEDAHATRQGDGWRFDVTLSHADSGWDDYADGWRVLDMGGNVLGYRELFHPHVDEQPFTRSLSGVVIDRDVKTVQIQARDSIGGWSAQTVPLTLP